MFNTVAVRAKVSFTSAEARYIVEKFGDEDDSPPCTRRPLRAVWDAVTINPRDGQTRRHNGESPEHRRQQYAWSQEHGRIVVRGDKMLLLPKGGESKPRKYGRPQQAAESIGQKLARLQAELAEAQTMLERMRNSGNA